MVSLAEFAYMLKENTNTVILQMQRELQRIKGFWQGTEADDREAARVQIFRHLFLSLENQALNAQQVRVLMAAQGTEYVPFLTSALNQALANNTAALKPTIEILGKMMGQSGQLNQVNIDMGNKNNVYMTTQEAMRIIEQKNQSVLMDSGALNRVEDGLIGLPEVRANQQGNLSHLGLKIQEKPEAKVPEIVQERPRKLKAKEAAHQVIEVEARDYNMGQ